MNQKTLFTLWGVLFLLCGALGFVPEPAGLLRWLMRLAAVAFFLPPFVLLHRGDRDTRLLIRNLSAASLGITLVTLILNFVLAVSAQTLGNMLHIVLTIVSVPMMASSYWVLSLFLWACVLMTSLKKLKPQRQ